MSHIFLLLFEQRVFFWCPTGYLVFHWSLVKRTGLREVKNFLRERVPNCGYPFLFLLLGVVVILRCSLKRCSSLFPPLRISIPTHTPSNHTITGNGRATLAECL
ncbi:hypothetical protein L873DRAFT_1194425 [Choiromyces venosus 120613-1]|uniref:Uncharacterized protein n=1 Tax=Choiromyces venosus 120613-1 TaxID=1336337 RepID=A0A3N4JIC6_9PEZI|nr:hypothetical protein L873DRAFT_1194425 [Choiromyces venosus 120613-1]